MCWKRKVLSKSSPETAEIFRPRSARKEQPSSSNGPRDSTARGWEMYILSRPWCLAVLLLLLLFYNNFYNIYLILNNILLVSGWSVLLLSAVASAAYEKACVLFSIAAMQTQVANIQDMKTDDGLKMAAKLFQVGWSAETGAKQCLNIYLSIVCFQ